jgi:hypothetical protein
MREKKILLELLVGYWNSKENAFMLDGQSLAIKLDDVYFIIILSH